MSFLKKGRPALDNNKRTRKIDARFTEEEYQIVLALERELGLTKTELIRAKVLNKAGSIVVNAKEMLQQLDAIGAELGRSGNNINQLARHANILKKQGLVDPLIAEKFNQLFENYLRRQKTLEQAMRSIIRAMTG